MHCNFTRRDVSYFMWPKKAAKLLCGRFLTELAKSLQPLYHYTMAKKHLHHDLFSGALALLASSALLTAWTCSDFADSMAVFANEALRGRVVKRILSLRDCIEFWIFCWFFSTSVFGYAYVIREVLTKSLILLMLSVAWPTHWFRRPIICTACRGSWALEASSSWSCIPGMTLWFETSAQPLARSQGTVVQLRIASRDVITCCVEVSTARGWRNAYICTYRREKIGQSVNTNFPLGVGVVPIPAYLFHCFHVRFNHGLRENLGDSYESADNLDQVVDDAFHLENKLDRLEQYCFDVVLYLCVSRIRVARLRKRTKLVLSLTSLAIFDDASLTLVSWSARSSFDFP